MRDDVLLYYEERYQHLNSPKQVCAQDVIDKGLRSASWILYERFETWDLTPEETMIFEDLYMRWCQKFETCLVNLISQLPGPNVSKEDLLDIMRLLQEFPAKDFIMGGPSEESDEVYGEYMMVWMCWREYMAKALDTYEEIACRIEKRESQAVWLWDRWYRNPLKRDEEDDGLGLERLTIVDVDDVSEQELLRKINSLLPSPIKFVVRDAEVEFGLAGLMQDVNLERGGCSDV